jgi:hypothetical protein
MNYEAFTQADSPLSVVLFAVVSVELFVGQFPGLTNGLSDEPADG